MYTSDTDRSAIPTAFGALLITILCAVFGGVYEIFSHGVWSGYMVYAFLFPLVLEALPFGFLALRGRPLPCRSACQLHHAGVATLTVGSLFQGALVIYGTSNRLTVMYWLVGILLITVAVVVYLLSHARRP